MAEVTPVLASSAAATVEIISSAAATKKQSKVWDFVTSWAAVAAVIIVLFSSTLETYHARPNFVKCLAYVTGDHEMQYKLGAFYYHGLHGLGEDRGKAKTWLKAAAEQGNRDAALYLGHMHYKGEVAGASKEEAHKWLQKGAKLNQTESQYKLGYLYYTGEGTERNYQIAARYFRTAAERKHAGSASMLGFMYYKGRGLPKHNKLAMLWFRRAAEKGDAKAMLNLGVMHYRGKGCRKDPVLAYMWFEIAHHVGEGDDSYNGFDYMNRLVSKGRLNSEEIEEATDLGDEWAAKHGLERRQGTTANPPSQPPEEYIHFDGPDDEPGDD